MTERNFAQVVRGRAIGVRVGTMIGCGWAAWGLWPAGNVTRVAIALPAAVVVVALLSFARRLVAVARGLPEPTSPEERAASRRVWTLFWINLVAEIVLLNVAVALLNDPAHRIYRIPAISLVVGLHFVPMAFFFRVPSYLFCAAAMLAVSLGVTVAIVSGAPMALFLVSLEALLNAAILWMTAGWGLKTVLGSVRRRESLAA